MESKRQVNPLICVALVGAASILLIWLIQLVRARAESQESAHVAAAHGIPSSPSPSPAGSPRDSATQPRVNLTSTAPFALARTGLPLFFEANKGQSDPRVRFLAHTDDYTLFLTTREMVFVHQKTDVESRRNLGRPIADSKSSAPSVLRMRLVGANRARRLVGIGELPGKVNYLIGNDPHAWHTNVPLYSQVRSERVYPGVDLVFHGDDRQLEYDFVVSPGADPGRIAFQFAAAERTELDLEGNLVLHTLDSQILMHKPRIYQPQGAERRPVEGAFVLKGNHEVGFHLFAYDHSQPLVIDPAISYATFLGGAGKDKGSDVIVDTSTPGKPKLYVPGHTNDPTTFPESSLLLGTAGGSVYEFIAKIDPTLTGAASLDFLTFIGGSKTITGTLGCQTHHGHLALDVSQGTSSIEPVLVGETTCEDFPVTTGPAMSSGGDDDYIARLMPDGKSIDIAVFFGGNGQMSGPWVSVDSSGNVILSDGTSSTNLPTTLEAYMTKFNNGTAGAFEDCFVAKFSRSLVAGYVTYLNVGAGTSSTNTVGCGAIVSASGLIGAGGGTFSSTAFAPAGGANGFQTTFQGTQDTFLMVLDPSLSGTSELKYATYIGGGGITVPFYGALSIGSGIVAIVGGTTSSAAVHPPDIMLSNAFQSINLGASSPGQATGFVTVIDTTKTGKPSNICSTYFGGSSGFDLVQSIGFDPVAGDTTSFRLLLGGQTSSINFPTKNPLQSSLVGTQNGFVSVLLVPSTSSGPAALSLFSTYIGGGVFVSGSKENETIQGVASDPNHTIYARGRTLSDNFFSNTVPVTTVKGFQPKCSSCSPTHASPHDDAVIFAVPNPAQTEASSTSVVSSLNPSTFGTAVTFTATVKPASLGTPTGTVTFKDGTTTLGTVALSSGIAKFTISTLSVGTHSITAVYGGDATFLGSTSAVLSQVVNSSGVPAVSFSPTGLSFKQQLIGSTSPPVPVTLTNSGTGALSISSIKAYGNFNVASTNCPISPATLAVGFHCTINITFTPSQSGKVLGELTVTDNAPSVVQNLGLSGNGVTPLNTSPTGLSFGTVTVGTSSASKTVTLINNSTSLLTISFSASADFKAVASGTTACGASLAGKTKCTISVTFTPRSNGTINGAVTISYNAAFSPVEVALSGSGTGGAASPLTFTPTSLSFASQLVGTTSLAKIVTVTNSSAVSVTISSISSSGDFKAFASGATPCSNGLVLASTHSCTFSVEFAPSVNGTITGAVWITDNSAVSPQVLNVSGKGAVGVSLSPGTLNFGTVTVGSLSASKSVTLTNNNQSSAVTLKAITASGDYKVAVGTCTGSIAAKGKCAFSVSFAPTAKGAISGVVSVSYVSTGSPQVVDLTGTGL